MTGVVLDRHCVLRDGSMDAIHVSYQSITLSSIIDIIDLPYLWINDDGAFTEWNDGPHDCQL